MVDFPRIRTWIIGEEGEHRVEDIEAFKIRYHLICLGTTPAPTDPSVKTEIKFAQTLFKQTTSTQTQRRQRLLYQRR